MQNYLIYIKKKNLDNINYMVTLIEKDQKISY